MVKTLSEKATAITESPLYKIAAAQVLGTIFVSVLCLMISQAAAGSAVLAGVASVVPSMYLWVVSLRPVPEGSSGIGLILRGEVGKYALIISILSVIFVYVEWLHVAAFFSTFVLMQICQMAVPLLEARGKLNG